MTLAVEAPAREDLSFRTNDDKLVGARWMKSDGTTPVTITTARLTLRFDVVLTFDPVTGAPLPLPPAEEHRIPSEDAPGSSGGWIEAPALSAGVVLAHVPHGIWSGYSMRGGTWDLIAAGEGVQRCLVRGKFTVEEGVSDD